MNQFSGSHFIFELCSQELLEAVEQERNIRANRLNTAAVFHHPVLGDFEVQHVLLLSFGYLR